ncbi:hypothetical protein M9Y10_015279 [Tritrichomonas musculus]|uniref:Tubby C-terminal domain-containing protein n=1 Tax=Tritrichomonas musculus TaxID=1915356 RepID=A0ABR2L1X8_9EUKA
MKHLYTITFDSDYSSDEEEVNSISHLPPKVPNSLNSNSRISPFPKSTPVKITTRNLSEEAEMQNLQLPEDEYSKSIEHKKKQHSKCSHCKSNNTKSDSLDHIENQKIFNKDPTKEENEYDIDNNDNNNNEETKNITQSKTYEHNHSSYSKHDPSNQQDLQKKAVRRPLMHRPMHPKISNDLAEADILNDDNHDLSSNNNNNQINISVAGDKNNSVDLISENNMNIDPKQKNTSSTNIQLKETINTSAYLSNGFPSQLGDPLHFSIIRVSKSKAIFNRKTSFIFSDNENRCFFEAKSEKSSPTILNITKSSSHDQANSQLNEDSSAHQIGVMICSPEMESFSLRLNNQYGREIMSARVDSKKFKNSSSSSFLDHNSHFSPSTGSELNPNFDLNGVLRLLKINFFFEPSDKKEKRLQNAESFGVTLDYGERNVLQSTKNFLLMDNFKREFVAVRKIEKNQLCVDFQPIITPLCAFAIGLIAFLYKV